MSGLAGAGLQHPPEDGGFAASAQIIEYLKDTHPDLYKSLRVAVRSRDRNSDSLADLRLHARSRSSRSTSCDEK